MSGEEKKESVKQVPEHLLGYLRSRILKYLGEVEEFSAEICQSTGQPARLIFYTGAEAKAGKQASDTSTYCQEEKESGNTILVRSLPENVHEEILELFFENEKRKGGGPVKSVYLNRKKNWALIEFSQPDAVDIVMSKLPTSLMDRELDIQPFTPLLKGDIQIESLDIRVLPKELTDDILTKELEGILDPSEMSSAEVMPDDEENAEENEGINRSTITDIMPVKLKMLTAANYPENILEQFPGIKIKIDHKTHEIVFYGSVAAIQSAKLNLYETLASFSLHTLHDIAQDTIELLQRERATEYVNEKLAAKELVCAWEVNGLTLAVCSLEAHIAECTAIIKGSVKETTFPISVDSAGNFITVEWQDALKQLQEQNDVICSVFSEKGKTEVHVTATVDAVSQMVESVGNFLKQKATIKSQTFSFDEFGYAFQRLSETNMSLLLKIVACIAKDLSVHYVTVERIGVSNAYRYVVTGTLHGIELAKERMRDLKF